MDTREAAERWRRTWARGWHGHDAGPILELYAPDATLQSHPFREVVAPAEYIVPTLDAEAWADCEFLEPIVEGDRAVVEWRADTRLKEGGSRSSPACRSCASTRTASSSSSATSGRAGK